MRKYGLLILMVYMLLSINVANASENYCLRADIDFSEIDWSMSKMELEERLDEIDYEDWMYEDGTSLIVFDAYYFQKEAKCRVYFDETQRIDEIDIELDIENDISPMVAVSLISSKLGMPIYCGVRASYESSDHYYDWQVAIWPEYKNAIHVYSFDNEIECHVDEDSLLIDFCTIGSVIINIYHSRDYDWVLSYYNVNK